MKNWEVKQTFWRELTALLCIVLTKLYCLIIIGSFFRVSTIMTITDEPEPWLAPTLKRQIGLVNVFKVPPDFHVAHSRNRWQHDRRYLFSEKMTCHDLITVVHFRKWWLLEQYWWALNSIYQDSPDPGQGTELTCQDLISERKTSLRSQVCLIRSVHRLIRVWLTVPEPTIPILLLLTMERI